MLSLIGRRLVPAPADAVLVSVLIFLLQQLLPGDPGDVMAGEENDPEVIAQIRAAVPLDQPIPVQYFYWIRRAHGRLRRIHAPQAPSVDLIAQKLPVSSARTMAMVIALVIGVTAGIVIRGEEGFGGLRVNVLALWASRRRTSGSGS
jgi:peptide/nickel transport system permease protein